MAYGTATGPDDVEAYYTHIRHGRPPEPEALKELQERYEMIGGSPLLGITQAQAEGIAAALEQSNPGEFTTAMGQKHSAPFIEDAVRELLDRGVERIVGIVLAPHFSTMSIAQYRSRAEEAAAEAGVPVTVIESWHEEPGYLEFLNQAITDAYEALPAEARESVELAVTAHSLPVAILERGDIYAEELERTRENLAGRPEFTEEIGSTRPRNDRRRVDRPGHQPDHARPEGSGADGRGGLRRRVRFRPPRGQVRHRLRGKAGGRRSGTGPDPHRHAE